MTSAERLERLARRPLQPRRKELRALAERFRALARLDRFEEPIGEVLELWPRRSDRQRERRAS